ncbi:TIR domain-containing protein [Avibacterium sp. 20-129]|uniref:TIR domain-containing protein n=1 Tax=Avibacterium sp. 20-129 TaxID=2911525 RepID=UPI002E112B12
MEYLLVNHHDKDQWAKEYLLKLNNEKNIFIDGSIDIGDIDETLPDKIIREKIRDEYLKDTTVTILLVGVETKNRKHIDWELYSSMYDGKKNKKSGILIIQLPSINPKYITAAHGAEEKKHIYPSIQNWISIDSREEFEKRYPYLPDRIIDNLLKMESKISVVKWSELTVDSLRLLIEFTFNDRENCKYDMSRPMRKSNS